MAKFTRVTHFPRYLESLETLVEDRLGWRRCDCCKHMIDPDDCHQFDGVYYCEACLAYEDDLQKYQRQLERARYEQRLEDHHMNTKEDR